MPYESPHEMASAPMPAAADPHPHPWAGVARMDSNLSMDSTDAYFPAPAASTWFPTAPAERPPLVHTLPLKWAQPSSLASSTPTTPNPRPSTDTPTFPDGTVAHK